MTSTATLDLGTTATRLNRQAAAKKGWETRRRKAGSKKRAKKSG